MCIQSKILSSCCTKFKVCTLIIFRCRKLPKALKEWQAFEELRKTIDDFNETCPLLEQMANKAMMARHWERIANTTMKGFFCEISWKHLYCSLKKTLRLAYFVYDVIKYRFLRIFVSRNKSMICSSNFQEIIVKDFSLHLFYLLFAKQDICISAVKEKDIEAKLKQVINDWSGANFNFSPFKNRGELLLKGDTTSETVALMEDSLMILGGLMSNR